MLVRRGPYRGHGDPEFGGGRQRSDGSVAEEVGGAVDGGTGAGEPLLEIGSFVGALLDRLAEDVERHVGQLLRDAFETGTDAVDVGHQRIASSINVIGCRTSSPALARWTMQPGLADATTAAPDRSMAASFRIRMSPERSGWSAAYAPPAPQHRPSSSSSTICATY